MGKGKSGKTSQRRLKEDPNCLAIEALNDDDPGMERPTSAHGKDLRAKKPLAQSGSLRTGFIDYLSVAVDLKNPNLVHYGPLFPEMSLIAVLEELQFGTLLRHDVKSEAYGIASYFEEL